MAFPWRRSIPTSSVALLLTLACAAAAGGGARADNTVRCGSETIGSGIVRDVSDGRTFTLAQGSVSDGDRYGRLAAHAELARDGAQASVAANLLAQGHARVAARVETRECAADLVAHERRARAAKLGLWGDPYYGLRPAGKPAELLAERGRFTLVEGKVLSVRESGGTIYVNFGHRWSEDFTVTIARASERAFTNAGLAPKSLAGRSIVVRGWIEERGGPWIEAMRPEQIEIAERK
jgi:hypothetical protein